MICRDNVIVGKRFVVASLLHDVFIANSLQFENEQVIRFYENPHFLQVFAQTLEQNTLQMGAPWFASIKNDAPNPTCTWNQDMTILSILLV